MIKSQIRPPPHMIEKKILILVYSTFVVKGEIGVHEKTNKGRYVNTIFQRKLTKDSCIIPNQNTLSVENS